MAQPRRLDSFEHVLAATFDIGEEDQSRFRDITTLTPRLRQRQADKAWSGCEKGRPSPRKIYLQV